MLHKLLTLTAILLLHSMIPESVFGATSENYTLDSAVIGNMGTTDASSENFATEGAGYPVFYRGENISAEDTTTGTGRGGPRMSIIPHDIDTHVYTETGPLTVQGTQSGTYVRTFTDPHAFVTLYISPNAAFPKVDTESKATFTIERQGVTRNDIPSQIPAASIVGSMVYTVEASIASTSLQTLRKFMTFIIETPLIIDGASGTHAAYYFHPDFKAWVRMPNAIARDDAMIFQTAYATRFVIIDLKKSIAVPSIVRTPETPDVTDAFIEAKLAETEGDVSKREVQEALDETSGDPGRPPEKDLEPIIVTRSLLESLLEYLRGVFPKAPPYIWLGVPPLLVLFGGVLTLLFRKR